MLVRICAISLWPQTQGGLNSWNHSKQEMRTIPTGLATLQAQRARIPASEFIVRDIRLRFDNFTTPTNPFYPDNAAFVDDTPIHPAETGDKFVPMDHVAYGTAGEVTIYTGPLYGDISYGDYTYGHYSDVTTADSIVGVIGYSNALYSRIVADPGITTDWDTWSSVAFGQCVSGSRPSIVVDSTTNKLFAYTHESTYIKVYESSDGGATWDSGTNLMTWPPTGYKANVGIAAVSSDEVFLCGVSSAAAWKLSVWRLKVTTETKWDNDWFSPSELSISAMTHFDAVQLSTTKHMVFFQGKEEGQTFCAIWNDGIWGTPRPVLPLDLIDTTSQFRAHHAENIQGTIWVTGHLKRPGSIAGYDVDMDVVVRSLDGEHWTFGRNAFVVPSETRGQVLLSNKVASSYVGTAVVGSTDYSHIYYPGIKTVYRAPATYLIDPAGDNPEAKQILTDDGHIITWELEFPTADGAANSFASELASGDRTLVWPVTPFGGWVWGDGHGWPETSPAGIYANHPIVKGGSWAWIYAGYDAGGEVAGPWPATPSSAWVWEEGQGLLWPADESGSSRILQLLDVVDIDQMNHGIADGERQLQIQGRGIVGKALKQTSCMMDYEFLSQIKWVDDYDAKDRQVYLGGTIATADGVFTASHASDINAVWWTGEEGIGSGIMWPTLAVQFRLDTGTSGKTCGIILNGADKDNYWYVKASATNVTLLERFEGTDGSAVATYSKAHAADTWYWLRVSYRGGRFLVDVRDDDSVDWVEAIDYTHDKTHHPAFDREEGMVGIRAELGAHTVSFRNPRGFSEEYDKTTDWLMTEAATLAGITSHTKDYLINQTKVEPEWWHSSEEYEHSDLTFSLPALSSTKSLYVALRSDSTTWASMTGYALRIYRSGASTWKATLINRDGTAYASGTDDLETITLKYIPINNNVTTDVRVVCIDDYITLYLGRYPVASFYDRTHTGVSGYIGLYSDESSLEVTNIQMPELYEWRPATIFDMGSAIGGAIGSAVLQDRRVKMFGDGLALRYSTFDTRSDLGTWTDAIFADESGPSDAERLSLARAIGVEVIESFDSTIARDHGLVFGQFQNGTVNTAEQLKVEADFAVTFSKQLAEQHSVALSALLDVQQEDRVTIQYTSPDALWAINDTFIVNDLVFTWGAANAEMEVLTRKFV